MQNKNYKINIDEALNELENISAVMAANISGGNYKVISKMDTKRRQIISLISDNSSEIKDKHNKRIRLVYDHNKNMVNNINEDISIKNSSFQKKKNILKAYLK